MKSMYLELMTNLNRTGTSLDEEAWSPERPVPPEPWAQDIDVSAEGWPKIPKLSVTKEENPTLSQKGKISAGSKTKKCISFRFTVARKLNLRSFNIVGLLRTGHQPSPTRKLSEMEMQC